jgi:hypothetical protein
MSQHWAPARDDHQEAQNQNRASKMFGFHRFHPGLPDITPRDRSIGEAFSILPKSWHILATMRELDLHDHTVDEALRVFVEFYNRHVRSSLPEPLRIIHGYGSTEKGGKIRKKLRAFLEAGSGSLEWKTGEDVEGNPGVTIIYPRRVLHAREDQLVAGILEFCSIPRTESKIAGAFRKHTPQEIKSAIRALVRQGGLKVILKGGHETYVRQPRSGDRV